MDIQSYIKNDHLKIFITPNAPKTKILGYDADLRFLRVAVHARPENNQANYEIIKFFSSLLNKKVRIKSGLTSRQKLLKIE